MKNFSLFLWFALALFTCACARQPTTPREQHSWNAQLDREHALVGRIWDVAHNAFISEAELRAQLQRVSIIIIGERHDHTDHHLLQTELLQNVIDAGRKPALVFEMLEQSQQAVIDASIAAHPKDADALAGAVAWEKSGWPEWKLYRPLFAMALLHDLSIAAAGIDRPMAMRLAREGTSVLDPELVRVFSLNEPLPPEQQAQLRQEMSEAHCGLLPESMLDNMVLVQRARDAALAERTKQGAAIYGAAVVILGNGHARNDRGVPALLVHAFGLHPISIGLVEVRARMTDAKSYAQDLGVSQLPFDYVWFTPRQDDVDHCEELRKSMAGSHAVP